MFKGGRFEGWKRPSFFEDLASKQPQKTPSNYPSDLFYLVSHLNNKFHIIYVVSLRMKLSFGWRLKWKSWRRQNKKYYTLQIMLNLLFSLKNSRPCQDLNPGSPRYQADMLPTYYKTWFMDNIIYFLIVYCYTLKL